MSSVELPLGFKWGIPRSMTGFDDAKRTRVVDMKACTAEFIGMILFVVIGCGSACGHGASDGETRMLVAFSFGMAIMVLAYAIGHHSGGHLNCAVTWSLVLGKRVPWYQGLCNLVAQLLGSMVGAGMLAAIFPCGEDITRNLGSNVMNTDYHPAQVILAEAFGTFLLCFTVYETAVTPQSSCEKNACIAIGFSVFLAHLVLLPIDGCSINPTRSFGPAVISKARGCGNYATGGLEDLWVMWLGPFIGASLAAAVQYPFLWAKKPIEWHNYSRLEATRQENALAQSYQPCGPNLGFQWGIDRSATGFHPPGVHPRIIDTKAAAAEFLGMTLFILIGCGAACAHGASDGETRLIVAFAFGMGIMVLAYVIGHHSGGHLNCAVTFSLALGGQCRWLQALLNLVAQLLGSILGAGILALIFPCQNDMTTNLGTNMVSKDYNYVQAFLGEAFGTFLLCYTVWETAVTPKSSCGKNACIAIGFSVFLAHLVLLPMDGCSINPTRSFGPAIVSQMRGCSNFTNGIHDLWVFWIGPLFGGALAAAVQYPFVSVDIPKSTKQERAPDAEDAEADPIEDASSPEPQQPERKGDFTAVVAAS